MGLCVKVSHPLVVQRQSIAVGAITTGPGPGKGRADPGEGGKGRADDGVLVDYVCLKDAFWRVEVGGNTSMGPTIIKAAKTVYEVIPGRERNATDQLSTDGTISQFLRVSGSARSGP